MNPRLALLASFALGLGLTVGCGGSSNGDLLNGGGNGGSGTVSSTGGGSNTGGSHNNGGNGGGHAGGSGNTGNTGGSGNTGNTGGSGNTGNTGGSGNTGNTGGSGNSGNTGGSGNTGNTGGSGGAIPGAGVVQCGSSLCKVSSQGGTCCASLQGLYCSPGNYCQNQPAAPIKCDGPEDCPGQYCCGTIMQYYGQSYYSQVDCRSSCNQPNERVFCGNHPKSCPSGTQCVSSTLLPGFHACGT